MSNGTIIKQVTVAVLIAACVGSFSYAASQREAYNSLLRPVAEHAVRLEALRKDVDQLRTSSVSHMDAVTKMLTEQAKQSTAQAAQADQMLRLVNAQMKVIEDLHTLLRNPTGTIPPRSP